MFEYEVSFTAAGSIDPGESAVTGFTLVDARGAAPDPDLGPIVDGATVDVSTVDGQVGIRADIWNPAAAGSVRLALSGPVSATRVENTDSLPLALFGDDGGGDYTVGWLPDGAYALTATPYAEPDASGDALPARTVTFTVTGFDASASKVTGLMLVDARGAAPDPDLGLIVDGAAVHVSGVGGRVNVRAEMAASAEDVGSVHLELSGQHSRAHGECGRAVHAIRRERRRLRRGRAVRRVLHLDGDALSRARPGRSRTATAVGGVHRDRR